MGCKLGWGNKTNSRAVSPVIATILMVAVVVIISASIAAVSLGFTDQIGDPTPASAFDFEHDSEVWIITHTHGDTLNADRLRVQVTEPDGNISTVEWPNSGSVSSGDSVLVSDYSEDAELSILWENNDRSATLARSTGSSAGSGSGGGGSSFDPENNIPSEGSGWYLDGDFENDDRWLENGNLDLGSGTNFQERGNSETVSIYTEGDVNVQNFDVKENEDNVFIYTIGDFVLSGSISLRDVDDVHIYVGGEVDIENGLDGANNGELILYGDSDYGDELEGESGQNKDVEDWPDN